MHDVWTGENSGFLEGRGQNGEMTVTESSQKRHRRKKWINDKSLTH